ncbi:hypothetical protein [Chromobacterium subtsugae]|uniref:hypothetical protein n=1 Tax=Chromobacterium subtsugae TaxID=251747 RepID=UPI000641199B|nr:hypothetical protein [Chromobacterium subtsugae]
MQKNPIEEMYEYEKLKFEIQYTASQILTCFSDLHGIKQKFDTMKTRMQEWEARASDISK